MGSKLSKSKSFTANFNNSLAGTKLKPNKTTNPTSDYRKRSLRNTRILGAVFVLLLVMGFSKLYIIQVVEAQTWHAAALAELTTSREYPGVRGDIVDRNGEILATTVDRYLVYVDQNAARIFKPSDCNEYNQNDCHSIDGQPIGLTGEPAIAKMLTKILDIKYEDLLPKLIGDSGYVVLKKNLTPTQNREIEALHIKHIVGTVQVPTRAYPGGNLASTILGNVGTDGNGLSGLELLYDEELTGKSGTLVYQKGLNGHTIPSAPSEIVEATKGQTISTTLDAKIQRKVQTAIDEGVKTNDADWGMAIVQEIKTGKILAMVDSEAPDAKSLKVTNEGSRVTSAVFEPGSTEKVLTMAALIETGLQSPTSTFWVPDQIVINNQKVHDSSKHEMKRYTLAGILANSSNVGTLLASENLTYEQSWSWMKKFGYGEPTGLNLPGESLGILHNWQDWDDRTALVLKFGQGVAVNAMQLTNAYTTIGNYGVKQTPQLVDRMEDEHGVVTELERPKSQRVISEDTASDVLLMMESVVKDGLVTNFDTAKYRIGGKSGTAQLVDKYGHYNEIMSSFAGLGPIDDPKYTVSIFFRNPKVEYWGALTAGPIFSDIMNFVLNQNNVPLSSHDTEPFPTTW
ncbi:MAG: penicillin-binding protein 2 [Bifidobacteriaceae bacterium]|nr:penicillin-binding protein 2 [Bifidobacteriaceae bacterium]